MSTHAESAPVVAVDRMFAFIAYGCMFLATFTLGLLALVGVLIAYSCRNTPDLVARSHFKKQIKAFWSDLLLIVLGAVAGYVALAGGFGTLVGLSGIKLPGGITVETAGWMTLALGIAWAILWIWGFLNLIIGSLFGAGRLAAGRPIGHLAGT